MPRAAASSKETASSKERAARGVSLCGWSLKEKQWVVLELGLKAKVRKRADQLVVGRVAVGEGEEAEDGLRAERPGCNPPQRRGEAAAASTSAGWERAAPRSVQGLRGRAGRARTGRRRAPRVAPQ